MRIYAPNDKDKQRGQWKQGVRGEREVQEGLSTDDCST